MDSSKYKICKIFAIILLNLYLRLVTATNIDCNGKSFHCVNSTHFVICVDFGGGVSITVNDFVIQCPPTTVCVEDNHLECTYQIPATTQTNIHPNDEMSDFTTNTRMITTTSNDITNTISTIDKTSMTALLDEHYNTIEVTTYANYAADVQTYTHDVSGTPEILNNNHPLSDYHSTVLTITTDLYSAENFTAKSPENHSPNEQIISIAATTVKDIDRNTVFSESTDLNSESSSMKLMDASTDAPIEILAPNAPTVINQEANTDVVNQLITNNNSNIGTNLFPDIIATTETILLTHYPRVQENHNFENISTTVKKTTNEGIKQKVQEIDNSFTSVIVTQINSIAKKEENEPKNSFLTSTENSNFNRTKSGSEIELGKEAELIYPKIESTKLINASYPFELNKSEVTEAYHITNMPSKLESTITPSRYIAETVLVPTESVLSSTVKETLLSSKRGITPTMYSPIISETNVSDNLGSKSTKSVSESPLFERTTTYVGKDLEKETKKIKVETIFPPPHLNEISSSPDGPIEETSNIVIDNLYSDYSPSTIDYQSTVSGYILEQKFVDEKFTGSTSYAQHISEVILQENISTTQANMPDLSVNTTSNSVNNDSTSLPTTSDSTIYSIDYMKGRNEAMKITQAYNNGTTRKSSQVSTEVSSSMYPIPFNYNASYSENTTAKEINMSVGKYNSSYQNLMTTTQININNQHIETLVAQTSHYTTEYNKLLSEEEYMLQVTENPYSDDTTLSIENRLSNVYLNEQQIGDNKTYIISPHDNSQVFISENVTTNPESHDFSVNTAFSLSDYDFTTNSLLYSFEEGTENEQVTNRIEAIERSTIPYHNTVPYTNASDNENATENSTRAILNSVLSKYRNSDVKKMATNETIPIRHYENSTYKPAVQNAMQKILYDTQIEKTKPLYNSEVIKDSIYEESKSKNMTYIEMNTMSTRVTVTETSCNTTKCNKLQENIQTPENPNSNDASLSVEKRILKSKLYLDDQQVGNKIINTSTQQEHYKSEYVSENSLKMNGKTHDLPLSTESLLPNFYFMTAFLISTLDQASELDQVTDEKTAIEGTTTPYANRELYTDLTVNEHPTEKSSLLIPNSTQSDYHISDVHETMKTTPLHHYKNSEYKPGIKNITQKIFYDTKVERTKPLIDLGPVKDSIIATTIGSYDVVSNVIVNESTTIKSEPMATINSVSDLVILHNGKIDDVHPLNYSDGRNILISRRDIISPNAEHAITSKNNIVDLNRVTVDSVDSIPVNFTGTITNNTNSINTTSIDKLEHKNQSQIVLFKSIEKFTRENKTSDTINEIYNVSQTSSNPDIYGDKHTIEVNTQNEEAFNDIMKLTSQNQNIQTTENILWEEYNLTQTEILVLNENVTSSTSKPLIMNSVTGVDETLSLPNQITIELVSKSYFTTDNPKDVTINTTNKSNFNYVQENDDSNIHVSVTEIENSVQKFTDQLQNVQTKQYITETIRSNNDTNTITTNKNVFNKHSEQSSLNFKSFNRDEEAKNDVTLESKINLNKTPPEIIENVHDSYTVTPKVEFVNISNNFTKSEVLPVHFPVHFYDKNDSITRDNMTNDIVTNIPKLDVYSNLSYTEFNKNTLNKNRVKTTELNTTSEDQVSNKESMFVTTKLFTNDPTSIVDKSYANYNYRITVEKAPLNAQIFFDPPSTATDGFKSRAIDATGELYIEGNKLNDTLKDHNTTGVVSNTTEHSQLLNLPIQFLKSPTTVPLRPLASLEKSEQTSLASKLNETDRKNDLNINNQNGSNYKEAANHQTKKDEMLTVKPRVTINVNKNNFATPNLVKIKLMSNKNVGIKPYKGSSNSSVFTCNYRSRGRFADKNNCRRYYICIGLKEPILGECPRNTVFSEIKKQCTKNLSHCIRNNQFRCTQEGRFSDVLRSNIYYICVHYNNTYVRFQFQCQSGFYLNKTSVRCVKDTKYQSLSQKTSLSADSLSNKGSDQSTVESQIKEKKLSQEKFKYTCKTEGKFPDQEDCRRYYVCTKNSKSEFRRRTKKCDSDEVFHREKKKCVDDDSYECY